MAEYAYKMFNADLTCTKGKGCFQYEEGKWYETEAANCAREGFHCAKNPLDCLSYYPDWSTSVCYVVEIGGDIDEDRIDSKVSCTRMRLDHRLDLPQFISHACWYMLQNPYMPWATPVKRERAEATRNGFAIARGKNPAAKGKVGDMIGILKEKPDSCAIEGAGTYLIDGKKYLPGVWYDEKGEVVTDA